MVCWLETVDRDAKLMISLIDFALFREATKCSLVTLLLLERGSFIKQIKVKLVWTNKTSELYKNGSDL